VIGDGTGTDTVQYGAANQIPDYIAVTVNSSGVLNLNGFSDTIGNLTHDRWQCHHRGRHAYARQQRRQHHDQRRRQPRHDLRQPRADRGQQHDHRRRGGAANDLAITAIVSGTAQVTKAGAGTLVLSGANTFTGTTTLNAGTLRATTSASALGAGSLTLAGGTLQLANDTGLNFARNTTVSGSANIVSDRLTAGAGVNHTLGTLSIGAQTLSLSAGANVTSGTAGLTFGATTLTGATVFDVAANANLTLGALTGNYAFTKQNSGTLTLNTSSGARTGGVTVSGGTLALGNTTALGATTQTITLAGGALDLNTDTSVGAYPVSVTANSTIASDKATANSAGITHTLGTLAINGSTLGIQSGGNVTANSAYGVTFGAVTSRRQRHAQRRQQRFGTGTLTLGALGDGGTARTFTKTGTGALTLGTAATSLVNGTAFNLNAGTINSNNATALGSLANVTMQTGATLNVGASQTLGALNGTDGAVNLGANTLTVGNATNNLASSYGGAIAGTGGNLTKAGTGTFTLTGANTYTGATSVSAGTLQLGTGGSAMTGGSAVTIASGATFDVENGQTTNSVGALNGNAGSTLTIGSGTLITTGGTVAGVLSGSGTLQNSGTLAITSNNAFAGTLQAAGGTLDLSGAGAGFSVGTLTLGAGTTLKLGSNPLSVTTLNITGASTIDFGNGVSATLKAGTFNLSSNTLTITNWVNGADYFFTANSSAAWSGATLGDSGRGVAPENQITFSGYSNNQTAWLPYDSTDRVITPAPEPRPLTAPALSKSAPPRRRVGRNPPARGAAGAGRFAREKGTACPPSRARRRRAGNRRRNGPCSARSRPSWRAVAASNAAANFAASAARVWTATAPCPTAGAICAKVSGRNSSPAQPGDAEPPQPGRGQDGGIGGAVGDLLEPRVHIAADFGERCARKLETDLQPAARAAGGDGRRRGHALPHHQHVARVLARQIAGDDEPGGRLVGQILRTVDGAIGRALQQRLFQLGGEEPLAALFLERPFELAVAGGDDLEQLALDAGPGRAQSCRHEFRLRERQRTFAGGQDELRHGREQPQEG
jgi:autotransporter-associated beta strand protein